MSCTYLLDNQRVGCALMSNVDASDSAAQGLTRLNRWKACGGFFEQYTHPSSSTNTAMRFSVYFPPQSTHKPVPVLYYLSGLTCTDENVVQKGFVQSQAAKRGLAVVCPDTSPRGAGVDGEDESWDFGTGAGFYVDATASKWSRYVAYSRSWRSWDLTPCAEPDEVWLQGDTHVMGCTMIFVSSSVQREEKPSLPSSVPRAAPTYP
jgi:S-formylglutathione hydrolase